ncbi:tetratricopeptide repeat protein [Nereida sp. MMG025]|uniref:tetratricopeptide repeat protein n=1 Tax=Nereida sp. MMG025 TaxID=2909981 RepID=UPI001F1A4B13|nr:tetratricopeptide repeat protein [Nereida sp. MMG025]MCF6445166.1 tetratricopeptide repeat protein [Nereida sp. MMG025]
MKQTKRNHLSIVTWGLLAVGISLPALAQDTVPPTALERLRNSTPETYAVIERELMNEWSRSGSPAMDLLLQRGRDALETGAFEEAIDHFTALTDHAPEFAEGYNGRATAYFRKGLFGPALDDIRRALVLNPNHYQAMIGFGIILEETGQKRAALEAYRKAASIHPHREDVATAIERLEPAVAGQAL